MATETLNKNTIPSFDFEKEMTRWNEFSNAISGPELSEGHTPRHAIWKKIRRHYGIILPLKKI